MPRPPYRDNDEAHHTLGPDPCKVEDKSQQPGTADSPTDRQTGPLERDLAGKMVTARDRGLGRKSTTLSTNQRAEAGLGCFKTQQARRTLVQQLQDGEVIPAKRIEALNAGLGTPLALLGQFQSGVSIYDGRIAVPNAIQRELLGEANESALPSVAGEAGQSYLESWKAGYALLQLLEMGGGCPGRNDHCAKHSNHCNQP